MLKAVMEGGGTISSDSPLERSENVADPLVHLIPAEAGIDGGLANRLEPETVSFHRVLGDATAARSIP
jgi:hypothetical protein